MKVTWNKPASGPTFLFATEFRRSSIPDSGNGWWAAEDIPAGSCLRRVRVDEGSLVRFASKGELIAAGWDPRDYVNYGICHPQEPTCVFFLNPGTAMNHSSANGSVRYNMDVTGTMEIWTVRDIKKGEEIFNDYSADFKDHCKWYGEVCKENNVVPISDLVETYGLQ